MVLKSFAKIHRQARVTAVKQAHAQIGALDMAGAD